MKRANINPVDVPGSASKKQRKALDKVGLPHTAQTTSREAALAIALYHREMKKDKPKKPIKKTRRCKLRDFAKELNKKLPKSEVWFKKLYEGYRIAGDQFNEPFGGFIPDVINKEHKYIIEVDGSMHDLPRIQLKDRKKDQQRERLGYLCIRIKAYDQDQFDAAMLKINARRYNGYGLPVKNLTEAEYRAKLKQEEEARSNKREGVSVKEIQTTKDEPQ